MTPTAPPSTDQLALLQTIVTDPADDLPRLVYADWLEENGQPERAEFIRVQVELARLEETDLSEPGWCGADRQGKCRTNPPCRMHRLRRRERELLADCPLDNHFPHTTSRLSVGLYISEPGPRAIGSVGIVRRGFVSELRADAATLLGGVCGRCDADGVDPSWTGRDEESSRCTACSGSGRTPGIARELLWWEGATDECPKCCGAGEYATGCTCDEGRISRPMPPTAQPVTRVVLTGSRSDVVQRISEITSRELGWEQDVDSNDVEWNRNLKDLFGPHVEWVLPETANA